MKIFLYRKVEWKIECDSFQFETPKIVMQGKYHTFSYKDTIDCLFHSNHSNRIVEFNQDRYSILVKKFIRHFRR